LASHNLDVLMQDPILYVDSPVTRWERLRSQGFKICNQLLNSCIGFKKSEPDICDRQQTPVASVRKNLAGAFFHL
jgi:hypothetical protein